MEGKCNDQLKDGCPFKDKLNEYFGKYRIGLCISRDNYTKEEFDIRYDTLMDLEKCVANAYIDLIYKGSTPDFTSIWKDYLDGSENESIRRPVPNIDESTIEEVTRYEKGE